MFSVFQMEEKGEKSDPEKCKKEELYSSSLIHLNTFIYNFLIIFLMVNF